MNLLKSFFVLLLLTSALPAQETLTVKVDSKELTFVALENGEVKFTTASHQFKDLPLEAQKRIMEFTGWGRVWEDKKGTHHVIADLVEVTENVVVLEKANGQKITVPIDRLSKVDRGYAESRRKLSGALPEKFTGKVVAVADGDTVTVLLNRRQYKVRLAGIDAPEKGQAFGTKSKRHLASLVHTKQVSGVTESTDRYGRNVCLLNVGSLRVDHEMLKSGLAWHYLKYSDDETRTKLETEAKLAKRNLWSENAPVKPWEWRRWGAAKRKQYVAGKEKAPVVAAPAIPKKEVKLTMSHWLNTKSKVRHNPGCRWFGKTKKGRMCTANDGKPCGQCGG